MVMRYAAALILTLSFVVFVCKIHDSMTVSLCLKFYCCPVLPFWSIARALFCCCFFFILTVGLETNYLRMHWTQLRQICRVGKHSGEDNQSEVSSRFLKGRCYGNRFSYFSAKIDLPQQFILCTAHCLRWMGGPQRRWVHRRWFVYNLANFGPVTFDDRNCSKSRLVPNLLTSVLRDAAITRILV